MGVTKEKIEETMYALLWRTEGGTQPPSGHWDRGRFSQWTELALPLIFSQWEQLLLGDQSEDKWL